MTQSIDNENLFPYIDSLFRLEEINFNDLDMNALEAIAEKEKFRFGEGSFGSYDLISILPIPLPDHLVIGPYFGVYVVDNLWLLKDYGERVKIPGFWEKLHGAKRNVEGIFRYRYRRGADLIFGNCIPEKVIPITSDNEDYKKIVEALRGERG